uniref:Predicted protein n=1 Tax=Hordeum vulgare subsp. vulgare TaxID=112509 RepID=F2CZ58_HORVV|nr:predicted protein [Hordeum vulgare subsp. vulgare]
MDTKTDGPFSATKCPAEFAHGTKASLDIAVWQLEPIKEQFPGHWCRIASHKKDEGGAEGRGVGQDWCLKRGAKGEHVAPSSWPSDTTTSSSSSRAAGCPTVPCTSPANPGSASATSRWPNFERLEDWMVLLTAWTT